MCFTTIYTQRVTNIDHAVLRTVLACNLFAARIPKVSVELAALATRGGRQHDHAVFGMAGTEELLLVGSVAPNSRLGPWVTITVECTVATTWFLTRRVQARPHVWGRTHGARDRLSLLVALDGAVFATSWLVAQTASSGHGEV